ncbi:MAG: molybdopterin molybdotransferase MoeA [Candidatus Thiosymbion ectosymbiont of Robbea hypermnestra]|nr:molybdopterin molybdotransferase MoeA [Candidatus Thiosymbion ectosymbiont of Robbea hypermnestra]
MTTRNDPSETPGARPPLSMEEALAQLLAQARPVADAESVPTHSGLGRVLAEPVVSTLDVPGWDNSAMDGYAVRSADLAASGGRLPVSQRIPAGVAGSPLAPGTVARIFTGAPVPAGADTVVIQESCTAEGDWVRMPPDVKPGANIRRTGEDIAAGSQVLQIGIRLRAQHLGLAASVGSAALKVYRRLRVAIFSSGDELVMPGTPLGPGQIYNSNRFTLTGLLQELDCMVLDLGTVEDTLEATMATLADAAERADLVVASGGVSVGEEDHVKPAVERLGSLDLWRVAIRPGKPLAFGHIGAARTPFIGTPGNPVSLFVIFHLFARPFIQRSQGITGSVRPAALTAEADFAWPRPGKRREFHRARLEPSADGRLRVSVHPNRSSAVLSSVAWANGLVDIPAGRILRKGDSVAFIPFNGLTA